MCHESLTYLRRCDQFESINMPNKQAYTLAHPSRCRSRGNNAVGNLGPALVVDTLRWPLTSSPGPPLPFLHFIFFFSNSHSAPTSTTTRKWKQCSTDVVEQKQRHPLSLPCVVCPTFAQPIIIYPFFSLYPSGPLGLCQINWGHPLILIHLTVLTDTPPHLLQIALGKKTFKLLIFLACLCKDKEFILKCCCI